MILASYLCQIFAAETLLETGSRRARNMLDENVQIVLNCQATYLSAKKSTNLLQIISYQGESFQYRQIDNDFYFVPKRFLQSSLLTTVFSLEDILEGHDEKRSYYFIGAGCDAEDAVDSATLFAQRINDKKIDMHKNQLKIILFNPDKIQNSQLINHLCRYFLETNVLSFVYHSVIPLDWASPIGFGIPVRLGYISYLQDFGETEKAKARNSFIYFGFCFLSAYWANKQLQQSDIRSEKTVDHSLDRGLTYDASYINSTNASSSLRDYSDESERYNNICFPISISIAIASACMGFKSLLSIRPFPSEKNVRKGFENLIHNYTAFGTFYDGIGRSPLLS